jgi:hypothetical protein
VCEYYLAIKKEDGVLYNEICEAEDSQSTFDIRKLQISAELFMIFGLLPYYVQTWVREFLKDVFGLDSDNIHKVIWFVVLAIAGRLGVSSIYRNFPNSNIVKGVSVPFVVFLVLAVLLGCLAALKYSLYLLFV